MAASSPLVFSYAFKSHDGHLILEILKNGQPFWEDLPGATRYFSFGAQKARLIESHLREIEKFVDSGGRNPGVSQGSSSQVKRIRGIAWHPGFPRAGKSIDRPYLELVNGSTRLCFGLQKATALVEYSPQVKKLAALWSA